MKIAHIQLLPILSGVQRVSLDEFNLLSSDNSEYYLICKGPGELTIEAEKLGVQCLYVPELERSISPYKDTMALLRLYDLFREHNFDVVHTHSSKTGVLGRIAAKIAGVRRIVHTVHGFAFPAATNRLEKAIYFVMEWLGVKCTDTLICLHDADKRIALSRLGAKLGQVEVIPNGVDVNKFRPPVASERQEARSLLGLEGETVAIGMVGRLWPQKCPDLLVASAIEILQRGEDVKFYLIGDGELRSQLQRKVDEANLEDRIKILGWRSDIPKLLQALDIFVLPSLWEGMPLSILEAQSTGLPCVVSDIQGSRDLIAESIDGLLFPTSDQEGMIEKLGLLITSKPMRNQYGEYARRKIEAQFNISFRMLELARVYRESERYAQPAVSIYRPSN